MRQHAPTVTAHMRQPLLGRCSAARTLALTPARKMKSTHTHTTTSAGQRLANGCTQQLRWQRRGRKQGVAVVPTMSKKCGPQKLLVSPTAHGARIDAPLLLLLLPPTHAVLAVADMSSADDSIKGGAEGQQAEGEAAK